VILALAVLPLVLPACLRETVHMAPPGAVSEAPFVEPAAGGETHRVLFLHGFHGYPLQFYLYWLAAAKQLPPSCELYLVTGVRGSMGAMDDGPDAAVGDLEDFLSEQDIPLENLHIVAHSMGGLVTRRFATLHPEALRQVFLLGTPSGGVRKIHLLNLKGWPTPGGIESFNEAHPPVPGIDWFLVAGDLYRDHTGGAFWEGVPNDGVISVESVLRFAELCGDSVSCEWETFPVGHPTWNWGENLLESPRVIRWVIDRIHADVATP